MTFPMAKLYAYLGISRQAVDQGTRRQAVFEGRVLILLAEAEELRREHPGCGVEKMYFTLHPCFIGRDRFVELFMGQGFRLKKVVNFRRTTYSVSSKYVNLIKGLVIDSPCCVWQSDITYYDVKGRFYYVVFIIDVYTKIIVGHQISDNMRAGANVKALQMALAKYGAPKIHHSDRGGQYIYKGYLKILEENGCAVSMCRSSQDNAYAERINRTIKEEYLDPWEPKDFRELKLFTEKAVRHYNNKRIHHSIDREKPMEFAERWKTLRKNERKKITIFNNESV